MAIVRIKALTRRGAIDLEHKAPTYLSRTPRQQIAEPAFNSIGNVML
jgi:hypothetical protein